MYIDMLPRSFLIEGDKPQASTVNIYSLNICSRLAWNNKIF
jgi:hypothetical protein